MSEEKKIDRRKIAALIRRLADGVENNTADPIDIGIKQDRKGITVSLHVRGSFEDVAIAGPAALLESNEPH